MATSTLKGTIFFDANQDGSQEGADTGIAGVVVRLYSADGLTLIATTTTSATGAYSFTGVTPGSYQVVVVPPSNDAFGSPGISTTLPNSLVSSAGVDAVTLTSGGTTTVNAGLHSTTTASFGGEAFVDANGDGLFDGSDAYLSGVTVQLYQVANSVSTLAATTTTASDGTYDFTGLAPGTYYAHIVTPTGSTVSTQGVLSPPQVFNPGAALTAATNLLTNGNFAAYSVSGNTTTITGWTSSANVPVTSPYGSGPGYGPEIQVTNGSSTGRYGVSEVADTVNPSYSAGVAAYFVDDGAIETLSQTVTLTAGQVYEIGFDLNYTGVGASNAGFFSLTASINGQTITTTDSRSGTQLALNQWTHFANLYTATTSGPVTLTFTYQSGVVGSSLASKDVLVDDVYIVKGQITADLTAVSQVNNSGNTAQVTLAAGQTSGNEDVGVYTTPATIKGTVFKDNNGDGALNGSDAGLANQTVNLSLNGLVIGSAVTDASGNYAFTNLVAGTYLVTVVAGSGYRFSPNGTASGVTDSSVGPSATPTVGGAQTITVAAAGTGVANAGEYVAGTLSGHVFIDQNANGVQDSGDTNLAGVTVTLLNASGVSTGVTTTTNSSGAYSFTGLSLGTYAVSFSVPTGYVFDPAVGSNASAAVNNLAGATGVTPTVALTAGAVSANQNGAFYAPSSLSGHVFIDQNADGVQGTGDTNLAGVTVQLVDGSGAAIAGKTATTDANGAYSFTGLAPGSYAVKFTAPAGDVFDPSVGSNASASLNNLAGVAGVTPTVVLTSGSTAANQNGALYLPSTISGHVFVDQNADGVQQSGDTNLAGVTVQLLDGSGAAIVGKTAITDANGAYSFTGLAPGSYSVAFTAPTGDTFDATAGGNANSALDSFTNSLGKTSPVTLTSGQAVTDQNSAVYKPAALSGHIFVDQNANAVQESGDNNLQGVTVTLYKGGVSTGITATTDANGAYSFTGLAPGSYSVIFTDPSGYTLDSATATGDAPHDAITGSSGQTPAVTLTSGQSVTDQNSAVYKPASLSGHIFVDQNANGVQESGDNNLQGVTVTLYKGGVSTGLTATTDANGAYSFTGLAPGSYSVLFTDPSGYTLDSATATGDAPHDAITGASGQTPAVTLTSGQSVTDQNSAVYRPASLSGHVFFDQNGDGVQQVGDTNLANVTVALLDSNGNAVKDANGHAITALTDVNGAYSFTGLAPGGYKVGFTAASGRMFDKVIGAANAALDSIVDPNGMIQSITLTPGANVTDQNAGEQVICFYPGTLIATPEGPRAVETLAAGDLVLTHHGDARPVSWMGRQTVSTRFGDPLSVLPIRIRAGALGEALPERDLLVSPCHAVLVGEVLVQAGALVNGLTITREAAVPERFTYHHVELADHSLILAEGVPAETFIDSVEGRWFDNWAERPARQPDQQEVVELDYPRVQSARQIPPAMRRRFATLMATQRGEVEPGRASVGRPSSDREEPEERSPALAA